MVRKQLGYQHPYIRRSLTDPIASLCRNVDGIQRVGIFARRNILPNEEITIDYNFSHFGEAVDCKCGSTACTGKIGRKRSEVPNFLAANAVSAKKRNEALEGPPPEIKRPVHVSSLALLKSAQVRRIAIDAVGMRRVVLMSVRVSLS